MSMKCPGQDTRNLRAAMKEGVSLQQALGKVIRSMEVKEFAEKIGIEGPNLLRAINPRHNPTQATINRLLAPFGMILILCKQTYGLLD